MKAERPGKEQAETQAELERVKAEAEQLRQQSLRLQADFENARKRWLKEQAEVQERANADVLLRLLEIFDDFERAVAVGAATKGGDTFLAGVEMIAKRMDEFLKSYGITPIESVGKPFDPERQEAVAHEASETVPESTVVAELRRGYTMNGRVLRPAVVKVAVKPEGSDTAQSTRKEEEQDGTGNRH